MKRKKFAILLYTAMVLNSLQAQVTVFDTIQSGGIPRDFRIYIPPTYDGSEAVPLLLNLHGYSSDNFGEAVYANFNPIADTAGFITVLPNGTLDGLGLRYWNCFNAPGTGVDDVAFISDLIDSISAEYNIDPNRIYSTGMSNGGFMSYTLAGELSNKIAAIASVAGTIDVLRFPFIHPARTVPVMEIHGDADPTVPYNGSIEFLPVDTVLQFWINNNHCDPTPAFSEVPDLVTTDNCTAEHYVWSNGWNNSSVELYKIIGGEHTWPGSAITFLGVTNQDFIACKEIWRFLSQYRLDELTAVAPVPEPAIAITIVPNPAQEYILVEMNINAPVAISIFNMEGKCILRTSDQKIDIQTWPNGNYFIKAIGSQFESAAIFTKTGE